MSRGSTSRRSLLKAASAGALAGLAGCTGGDGEETETAGGGGTETGGTPASTATEGTPMDEGGMEGAGPFHILTDYSNKKWQQIWDGELVPQYQEQAGVTPRIEYAGFQGVGEQRLTTLIQSGNAPEGFTGGPDQLGDMLARGQLATSTETLDQHVEESDAGELITSPLTLDGETYNFPHGKYFTTFLYRRDIIEQLGLEEPTTMEQIRHNAQVIDEADEVEARGYALAGVKAGKTSRDFEVFLSAMGGWHWQWKTNSKEEPEVWLPKEETIEVLNYMKELAEYSPDPAGTSWGESLSYWAGDRVAQQINLNAWPAGVAANADNTAVARNTEMIRLPTSENAEQYAPLVSTDFDGQVPIALADNVEGMFTFLKWMYSDPEKASQYYLAEPTRFIPAWSNVLEADNYQNGEIFQEVPHLLEMNQKSVEEFAPLNPSEEKLVLTPATIFAGRFPIASEMVNQVITADRDPEKAWEEARDRRQKRLEEGLELESQNF